MKKVTLVLPDKITKVGGTSRSVYEREVEITAEEIIKILCEQDYHSSYKISPADVTVLSVEDYQSK
jgi:hypothetical protein